MSFVTYKIVNSKKTLAPFRLGGGIFGLIFTASLLFTKTETKSGKGAGIFFLVIFLLMLIKGIVQTRTFKAMYLIDPILAKSEKNVITLAELSMITGIGEKRLHRLIKKFIRKKFFHDVELFDGDEPSVHLKIESDDTPQSEIELTCPDCGVKFTTKLGAVARCPECASIINI